MKWMDSHIARDRNRENIDLATQREQFLSRKNNMLYNLQKSRYEWMNKYIREKDTEIYEIGSGIGSAKSFIKNRNLKLTDVLDNPWIDRYLDALDIDFPDDSVDVFICCNCIHHFAKPYEFLKSAAKSMRGGWQAYYIRAIHERRIKAGTEYS